MPESILCDEGLFLVQAFDGCQTPRPTSNASPGMNQSVGIKSAGSGSASYPSPALLSREGRGILLGAARLFGAVLILLHDRAALSGLRKPRDKIRMAGPQMAAPNTGDETRLR